VLPSQVYGDEVEKRILARRLAAKRLPESIVANRRRGIQGSDNPELIGSAQLLSYIEAIASRAQCHHYLNITELRRAATERGSGETLNLWLAIALGRFVCWWESRDDT